ncbi:Hpt domain-containing protein [Pseudobdellovibrio sp. HCB154]|uniref:Hpt domain-containing protein n=1 Tax=Pseudobdellovibrio sp. HCB154 TaxID=3386277 RepID=UPI003916D82C
MIETMQVPVEARQKYLERRKQDVVASKEALSKQDYSFLERLGHQVKGNAITFGFDELTNIAVAIEQAAKAKNITQLQTLIEQFESAVNNAHL